MDNYTATELAYKNGYEQGKKDAVVHGRWVKTAYHPYYCSVCDEIAPLGFEGESHYKSNYCPNCGANMDAE